MIDTCALYGASTYANSWLGINVLVVLISLMAVAAAFSLSSLMPSRERGKIRGFVRFEMIQTILSVVILVAILGLASTACSISANMSSSLSGTTRSPFQYADWYIGTVSLNHGLNLLTNIYAIGVRYAVYTAAFKNVVPILGTTTQLSSAKGGLYGVVGWLFGGRRAIFKNNFVNLELGSSGDVSTLFGLLSSTYLAAFSPIIMIAVGLLFIQFLALPIMQYTAFTVVLPIALAARSIAFFNSSIGDASNALIAIALALYIIYPMMVAFDSYAIAYVFSASNPSAQYANMAFTVNTVAPNSFFSSLPASDSSIKAQWSFLSGAFSAYGNPWYNEIINPVTTLRQYIDLMAQFVFESIVLFALNIAVTVGLALSVYKGLKSGLGESGRFW